jgi:hypothetical protein
VGGNASFDSHYSAPFLLCGTYPFESNRRVED